mmetsp:Transcript_18782/g.18445  ORF Transcript_18782/g.18445 Transcript_18782/m.18445 type:complete len:161 (+) Transcript_18782:397-879(+)
MKDAKRHILEKFINPETGKPWNKAPEKYSNNFRVSCPELLDMHSEFLDDIFKMIINNLYPLKQLKYWKILDGNYDRKYEVIRDFFKCSKYKLPEFKEKHKFNAIDEYVISFKPNKDQFNFLVDLLKMEANIKAQYRKAVDLLLQAKTQVEKATGEIYNHG